MTSEFPSDAYTEYSLWLLPAEPQRTLLRSTIQQLAATYQAVDFEPHVTVSCGPSTDGESVAIAEEIARTFSPLHLTASGFAFTGIYTKTLFIQFDESDVLRRMFNKVCELSAKPQSHILNPHLSLLYKTMRMKAKPKHSGH